MYGVVKIELDSFPDWDFYLAPAAVLNLVTGWAVLARPGNGRLPLLLTGYLSGAVTIVATVAVAAHYRDGTTFFGSIVPAVMPRLGTGAPVAIVSALASCTALTIGLARNAASARRRHLASPLNSP